MFNEFGSWLEYSIEKDAAFCLFCYLFKDENGDQGGGDKFIGEGFRNWKKKEKFVQHEGNVNSAHNKARQDCEALMNQKQHIETAFSRHSDKTQSKYRALLTATIDCIRFLLKQRLAFRGHDESKDSSNQGNFLELLHFLADHNENIDAVTFENAPRNLQLTSNEIQKDIVSCASI